MRGPDGNLLKPGDVGYLKPSERAYAEQKTGILPLKFIFDKDVESAAVSGTM
jgi:hypothetical protein